MVGIGRDDGRSDGVTLAARLADARGDDATALKTLEQGLARHLDAPAIERAHALLYRAELAVRVGDADRARTSLAEARAVDMDAEGRAALAADFVHVESLVDA